MIQPERVRPLNDQEPKPGRYVLYWMQASQRTRLNHALEFAIAEANNRRLPLLVGFGLTRDYPEANVRHLMFLLEGLRDVRDNLTRRGVGFVARLGDPPGIIAELAEEAALVVTDTGYLRHQRLWRHELAQTVDRPVFQVETDAVVPVETAYPKEAWSAAVLRRPHQRLWSRFLVPLAPRQPTQDGTRLSQPGLDLDDPGRLLAGLELDHRIGPVPEAAGGEEAAQERLREFLKFRFFGYAARRNDPAADRGSGLSPYLHFGQISPLEIALAVQGRRGTDAEALLEQLLIRRELALNFCRFNRQYDRFEGLPEWARSTLAAHRHDPRPAVYSFAELEAASTHDRYWNAAQTELVRLGTMHNYMRMYWGKKILEWMPAPREAFDTALRLNNAYQLDGRDPNSYAGVAWVFGKHDRPWSERPIFGAVRYMNESGLKRKFDIEAYVERVTNDQ